MPSSLEKMELSSRDINASIYRENGAFQPGHSCLRLKKNEAFQPGHSYFPDVEPRIQLI
jgi:hypothetical protein